MERNLGEFKWKCYTDRPERPPQLPRHQFSSILSDSSVFHSPKLFLSRMTFLLGGFLEVFSSNQIFVNSEILLKSVLGVYITGCETCKKTCQVCERRKSIELLTQFCCQSESPCLQSNQNFGHVDHTGALKS